MRLTDPEARELWDVDEHAVGGRTEGRGFGGIILRPWAGSDRDALLAAFGDPAIRHFAGAIVDTASQATAWLERRAGAWADGSGASWSVRDADAGSLLGHVSLHETDRSLGIATTGYWLLPRARGRGVATRAVSTAARFGFTVLDCHRLELCHAVENQASCAVAQRCGFAYEGTLRASMRYPVDQRWSDEHLHARLAADPAP